MSWYWLQNALTWCLGPELSNPFWGGFQMDFWHGYPKKNDSGNLRKSYTVETRRSCDIYLLCELEVWHGHRELHASLEFEAVV